MTFACIVGIGEMHTTRRIRRSAIPMVFFMNGSGGLVVVSATLEETIVRSSLKENELKKIIAVIFAAMLLTGVAYASIPDSSGVIHGCVKNGTTGQREIRVIDTAYTTTCMAGWTAVTWNQEGPQGATGPAGPQGATGPAGADGVSGYEIVHVQETIPPTIEQLVTAPCPVGKSVLGGGYQNSNTFTLPWFSLDGPVPDGSGWNVRVHNRSFDTPMILDVWATCGVVL
jgi:hypothetical protein